MASLLELLEGGERLRVERIGHESRLVLPSGLRHAARRPIERAQAEMGVAVVSINRHGTLEGPLGARGVVLVEENIAERVPCLGILRALKRPPELLFCLPGSPLREIKLAEIIPGADVER